MIAALDPARTLAWSAALAEGLRLALRWGAQHTGLPVVVVAALALALSWRVLRRSFGFAVEVAVALVLLLVMSRLGLITW